MIQTVKHLVRVAHAALREHSKKTRRSSEWPKVEHTHLKAHPTCAACGSAKRPQVHHKKPYHLHPELELDPANLITLCMDTPECHLRIGHGDSFKAYNPNVESDAAILLVNPALRAEYEERAKASRLMV